MFNALPQLGIKLRLFSFVSFKLHKLNQPFLFCLKIPQKKNIPFKNPNKNKKVLCR
jgi:hypothetical protein